MREKSSVRFVYFDLGWVIIPIEKDDVAEELSECSELPLDRIKIILEHGYTNLDRRFWNIVEAFDRGKLYPVDFYWQVCEELRLKMSFRAFARIWQMMLGLDERFIDLIKKLRMQGVRTGIISDLCVIHYEKVMEILDRELFDICFFSFMEKCLKADPGGALFKRAVRAANLSPEQILFVDDREVNIEAAKQLGLKTSLYKNNFSALTRHMRRLGLGA